MLWRVQHPQEAQLSTQLVPRMLETAPEFSLLEANVYQGLIVPLHAALDRVASALALEHKHKLERLDADSCLGMLRILWRLPLQLHPPPLLPVQQLGGQLSTQLARRTSGMARAFSSLGDSVYPVLIALPPAVLGPLAFVVVWEHRPRLERLGVGLFRVRSF